MNQKKPPAKKSTLLETLQARTKPTIEKDDMSFKTPEDSPDPPNITKVELLEKYGTEMFDEIEAHMGTIPRMPSFTLSFPKLIKDLFLEHMTELERIRTLFLWLIWQDYPSIKVANFPDTTKEDSPMGYFRDIVNEDKTFAHLFARMAKEAEIPVQEIEGFIKGVTWFPDNEFTDPKTDVNSATWNAVWLDGHWRFIDIRRALPPTVFQKSGSRVKVWEDFYFLPEPSEMINSHFPHDKVWQLLPMNHQIGMAQFQAAVKKWPMYFNSSLKLPKQPGLIKVPDGYFKLELEIPDDTRDTDTYKVELLTRSKMTRRLDGVTLTRYTLHYSEKGKDIIEVYLPKAGEYILELYLMSTKIGLNIFNILAIYQLNCENPASLDDLSVKPPFARVCSYYGLSPLAYQLGIGIVEPLNAIAECDENGEGKVKIYYNEEPKKENEDETPAEEKPPQEKRVKMFLEFVQNLYDANSRYDDPLVDFVVQCPSYKDQRDEITFKFRAPHEGNFALTLYYTQSRDNPEYTNFAHFQVSWKRPEGSEIHPIPFPHVKQGKFGPVTPGCDKWDIRLVNVYPSELNKPDEAMVTTDEYGEVVLCFQHSLPISLIAEHVDDEVSTMIECTPQNSFVTIRTDPIDDHKVFIFKIFASEMGQTESFPLVYLCMVTAEKPKNKGLSLPKCPSYYWGGANGRLQEYNASVYSFSHSLSWTQEKFNIPHNSIYQTLPCRLYRGGHDMNLVLKYDDIPFTIHPTLKLFDKSGDTSSYNNFCIVERATVDGCTISMRFPKKGFYVLAVYCAPVDDKLDDQKLNALYYSLIVAEAKSKVIKPYPKTFAVWGASAVNLLTGHESDFFKHDKAALLKIDFRNFLKQPDKPGYKAKPYGEVLMLVDDVNIITPKQPKAGKYEWFFTPTAENKEITIVVVRKPYDDEILYALQYTIK